MGPKQPSRTTQISEVKLPAWVEKASKKNYDFAVDLADQKQKFYTGDRVADMSPAIAKGFEGFFGDKRAGKAYGDAGDVYGALSDFNTGSVKAGMLADADLSKYMNPYVENVVNRSMDNLDRQRSLAIMANADKAKSAGAFGGSKAAIVDAVTNSESARQAGDLSANLYSDAYDKSMGWAGSDIDRKLNTDMFNTQRQQQDAQIRAAAAAGKISVGDAMAALRQSNLQANLQKGMLGQNQRQREMDAKRALWEERNNEGVEDLNLRLSALGMSPYGKSESTTKTSQSGGGTDFASIGAGFLSLLPMLMGLSDEDEKTDIKKIGKDEVTGLDLYSYRYKGDPKTYPKVVGPMAQDIEKKFPELVVSVGGKKAVLGMGRAPKKKKVA